MTVLMQSVLLLLHMDIFCNHVLISYKCFRFLEFFFFFFFIIIIILFPLNLDRLI